MATSHPRSKIIQQSKVISQSEITAYVVLFSQELDKIVAKPFSISPFLVIPSLFPLSAHDTQLKCSLHSWNRLLLIYLGIYFMPDKNTLVTRYYYWVSCSLPGGTTCYHGYLYLYTSPRTRRFLATALLPWQPPHHVSTFPL